MGKQLLDYLRDAFGIDLDALADRVICSDYDMLVRGGVASPMLLTVAQEIIRQLVGEMRDDCGGSRLRSFHA